MMSQVATFHHLARRNSTEPFGFWIEEFIMYSRGICHICCAFLMFFWVCGCGKQDQTIVVAPPSTDHLPLVDTPDYLHWKQFPVGTKAVRYKEITNKNGTVYVTTTLTLMELNTDKAVVEQQISVKRPEGDTENPPQSLEYFAKFRLPEGMKIEDFTRPSRKAELVGKDTQEFCGRTEEAERYEWVETNEAGPMKVVLWRSENVPGRAIREETLIERDGDTSIETLIELQIPEKGS